MITDNTAELDQQGILNPRFAEIPDVSTFINSKKNQLKKRSEENRYTHSIIKADIFFSQERLFKVNLKT